MKSYSAWQWKTFAEICTLITDGTHKTPKYQERGIRFISTANLLPYGKDFDFRSYSKFISKEEHCELTKRAKPEKGDILISKCGTIGRTQAARVDYDFSIFVGLMLLKVKKELVVPEFLEFYLNQPSVTKNLENIAVGSSRSTLTIKAMKEFVVLLPPLAVQKQIVAILQRAERIKELRDQGSQMTNRIVQAVFLKMFGDPIARRAGWRTDIIDNLTSTKATKGSTPTTYGYKWESEGVLFLRSECITSGGISLTGSMNIGKDAHEFMQRSKVYPGDILIRITGEVGIAAIFPKELQEANINQHIAIVRLREDSPIEPVFLAAQINVKPFRSYYSSITRGVTHPHLSLQQIRETRVIIPPQDLQKKFVSIYNNIESIKEKHKESGNQINCLFNSLMLKAFRGELTRGEAETSKHNKPLIQGSLNPQ